MQQRSATPAIKPLAPALIEWDEEAFSLGVEDMDATHAEFITLMNRLDAVPNSGFSALFTQLIEHSRSHFDQEESRMLLCKFPATSEHSHEHRRVLGELARIGKQVDKGLVSFGRVYVREGLTEWFRLHAATMDSALAAHWKHYRQTADG